MAQTPIERARVRQGRDGDRPTEDDIAKAKLGPQGVPGKPDKSPIGARDDRADATTGIGKRVDRVLPAIERTALRTRML